MATVPQSRLEISGWQASSPWRTHRRGNGHGFGLQRCLLQTRLSFTDFSDGCPSPWFLASKPEGHPQAVALEELPPPKLEEEKENPRNFPKGRQLGQAGGMGRAWASLWDLIQGARSTLSPGSPGG